MVVESPSLEILKTWLEKALSPSEGKINKEIAKEICNGNLNIETLDNNF